MILLTSMPGLFDYMFFISIFALLFSLVASLLTTGIVYAIKKNERTKKYYFSLGLKVLGFTFIGIDLVALLILST